MNLAIGVVLLLISVGMYFVGWGMVRAGWRDRRTYRLGLAECAAGWGLCFCGAGLMSFLLASPR